MSYLKLTVLQVVSRRDFTWDKITVRAVWGEICILIQRVVAVARKNNSMRKLDPPTPAAGNST